MGVHEREILCPDVLRLGETVKLHLIRSVVMRVHIDHIPCGIIIILIIRWLSDIPSTGRAGEVPMHREVDYIQTGCIGVIGGMIGISIQ